MVLKQPSELQRSEINSKHLNRLQPIKNVEHNNNGQTLAKAKISIAFLGFWGNDCILTNLFRLIKTNYSFSTE
jgi:hypothetical protein